MRTTYPVLAYSLHTYIPCISHNKHPFSHTIYKVGRAGRDGQPASCTVLLDDNDFLRLRSLAASDGVDEVGVRG